MQPPQITAADFAELKASSTDIRLTDDGSTKTTSGSHQTVGEWSVLHTPDEAYFGVIITDADPDTIAKLMRARTAVPHPGDEFGNDAASIA